MIRIPFFTTITASLLASAVWAQDLPTVKDVDVSIDLTAIQNAQAATYWTTISDDLETAIVARLTDRIAEDGATITVDLSEVELASAFQEVMNIADSKLVGSVRVASETDKTLSSSYELMITMDQAIVLLPEGADLASLSMDSREYYEAMVNAFAQAVIERLDD